MINLLPPDVVSELRAARVNTMLRRYLVTSLIAVAIMVLIFGASFYLNAQNYQAYQRQRQESRAELDRLSDVKTMVKNYNQELATAEDVYDEEIKMTALIANFSSVLPPGSVLESVSFSVESFTDPVTITANLDTFEKAGVLKRNLSQSEFFTDVVLEQVSEKGAGSAGATSAYPFSAQMQVTLTPEAVKQDRGGGL